MLIYDVNIHRTVVVNKVSFGKKSFKCFIGYEDNEKVVPLCVMFPKISGYRKKFSEAKYVSLLITDNELLEKYDEIWDKDSSTIKKGFDCEPVCNKKYVQTKIKPYEGKSIKIFIMIKRQKMVLTVFAYQ